MEGPRAPHQEEWNDLILFLDENLRAGSSWSVANEYPTTFTSENQRNIRVIYDEGKILSHAVWKPILIRSPQAVYKFAAIGSVVTSENNRKQGLSKQILESCLDAANGEDCDFAILWTDLFDFYRKLGFELAGSELTFHIDKAPDIASDNYTIREGKNIDPNAILRVFSKHTVSTVRTMRDLKKYLDIPNSRVYTAWGEDGSLVAYAIEGKGADLQGYIHEWGGSTQALLYLVGQIKEKQKRNLFWMIPWHSQNLILELEKQKFTKHHGYLGMIKLLNTKRFCEKIEKYLRLGLKDQQIQLVQGENKIQLKTKDSEIEFTEQELVSFAFGPKVPEVFTQLEAQDYDRLNQVLPMPLWIWGWDSI